MPNTDFYVINFTEEVYKPNFSACYGKLAGGKPEIWSKLIDNSFFEDLCGDDKEDYLSIKKYKVLSEEGVGIGERIKY